ncbi:MAG: 4'-phosphopantetheinyl transferase superfamily protein [Eubacteriales bacterium]
MNLYYCNIHEFHTLEGCHLLLPQRQEAIGKYRQHKDQIRSLVAGLLIRKSLGPLYYTSLQVEPYGKPIVSGEQGPYFNVSHSGDYVVLGVSDTTIGVDIEVIDTYSSKVARKCYTDREMDWLESIGTNEAFYQLWCGKESVMKAYGQGFHMDPKSFSILPIQEEYHSIGEQEWYLYWHELNGHQICVCSAKPEEVCLIPLGPNDLIDSTEIG